MHHIANLLGGGSKQGGRLQVTVVEARRLARKDVLSKSDPYCIVSVGHRHEIPLVNHLGTHYKTSVMNNNQDPTWNQTFTLNVSNPETEILRVKVYDYDHMSFDDLIGEVDVPLFNLRANQPKDDWYQLSPAKGGSIRLIITPIGFGIGGGQCNGMGYGMQAGGGATPYQTPYVQQGTTMPPMGYGMVTPPMGMGIQPAFIAPAPAPYGYAYQAAPPPYYY